MKKLLLTTKFMTFKQLERRVNPEDKIDRGKERKERSGGEGREDEKIKRSWKTLSFLINRAI